MPRYIVAGPHRVLGNEPGAEFEAELSEVQEARLLAGGHLALVTDEPHDDKE